MEMTHARILTDLAKRWPEHQIGPSLGRIEALMELLGDPQRCAPVIAIAGTNGKGSTAIMIDALLRAQGLRTGRYTSPHLSDPRERIAIDGRPVSEDDFDRIYQQILPFVELVDGQAIDGIAMTAFELLTGLAFAAFADAPIDVMVIETGMGGTWDATNVADAQVAVITPIGLDHMDYLGDTIEDIANEKAGIIKADSVLVVAGQEPAVARVLLERASSLGIAVIREGIDFALLDRQVAVGGQLLRLDSAGGPLGDVFLPLHGAAMAHNAVLAVAAVEALEGGRGLDPAIIETGLADVEAPARLERLRSTPPIVVDSCHNPPAVQATLDGVEEAFAFAPLIAIWGMMADKQIDEVLALLNGRVSYLVATSAQTPRALSPDQLGRRAELLLDDTTVFVAPDLPTAIDQAVALADETGGAAGIMVGGSVALAGEARTLLAAGADQPNVQ
ncbi:MAG: bifunctional folylpolyglutamate synthase/dihydrofolate synthase [Propionibacteriaceae bacterium]|jgi:dihydrofolate synthase/folylpolyglutamate synthase|nr:bifunctional folylpolyglutamate synthase/dihydrofolate synthase [Propionibacteriaceae bacterium]